MISSGAITLKENGFMWKKKKKERRRAMDGKQQKIKLISVQLYTITLDIKGLNAQIKRDSE